MPQSRTDWYWLCRSAVSTSCDGQLPGFCKAADVMRLHTHQMRVKVARQLAPSPLDHTKRRRGQAMPQFCSTWSQLVSNAPNRTTRLSAFAAVASPRASAWLLR